MADMQMLSDAARLQRQRADADARALKSLPLVVVRVEDAGRRFPTLAAPRSAKLAPVEVGNGVGGLAKIAVRQRVRHIVEAISRFRDCTRKPWQVLFDLAREVAEPRCRQRFSCAPPEGCGKAMAGCPPVPGT
jgi:hypothetical protein